MIGTFYNCLHEIIDKYRQEYGNQNVIVEALREVDEALHDAWEQGESDKIFLNDKKPTNMAEALAFSHERVKVYQDPNDGQLMYEIRMETGESQYYTKHCDTALEATRKIMEKWDSGWRYVDRLKQEVEYLKARNEELTSRCKTGSDKSEYVDGILEKIAELTNYVKGEERRQGVSQSGLTPAQVKTLVQKELDKLPPNQREKYEPLEGNDAVAAIMINRSYTNKQIARELHISTRKVTAMRQKFTQWFGEGALYERRIPLYKKKETAAHVDR